MRAIDSTSPMLRVARLNPCCARNHNALMSRQIHYNFPLMLLSILLSKPSQTQQPVMSPVVISVVSAGWTPTPSRAFFFEKPLNVRFLFSLYQSIVDEHSINILSQMSNTNSFVSKKWVKDLNDVEVLK